MFLQSPRWAPSLLTSRPLPMSLVLPRYHLPLSTRTTSPWSSGLALVCLRSLLGAMVNSPSL